MRDWPAPSFDGPEYWKLRNGAYRSAPSAGNVSMTNMPPQEEAHFIAEQIQHDNVKSVVINMEHVSFDQGLAQKLADHLGGPCYTLSELKAASLYQTVQKELNQ